MIAILLATSAVASGVSLLIARLLCRRGAGWSIAVVPAALFVGFLRFYETIAGGRTVTEQLAWAPSLGVELSFRLDGFAFLFCLLVTGVGTLVVIYADAYLAERTAND